MLRVRGKNADAELAFLRAGTARASDSLAAALNLAILHYERGDRERAMQEFDRFIDAYNGSGGASLTAARLITIEPVRPEESGSLLTLTPLLV